ncbi:FAD-binding oxidoreductase [Mycoplasmatota bacterium]|nr:FAD-binding oxidoreductase [Mycoplasmatota bacterium]
MIMKANIVIVGGGVSGCAIAYNLAKKGVKDIIVLDKSYLTSGATGRCGAGVRQQWGTEMNCRIAKASIEFFEGANEELQYDGDIEFKQEGYLLVASTEKENKQFEKNVELQNKVGIDSRKITLEEAKEIVPYLNTEKLIGAAFCPTDGHLNPFLLTDAYFKAAKRLGVKFYMNQEVTDIEVIDGKVNKVITNDFEIETDVVVNAAGGYSKDVGEMVGVDIPVFSENHEILVTEPIEKTQGPMVMSFSLNIYCQQTPHGSFIMGRGDKEKTPGYNIESTWKFLDRMADTVVGLLPPIGNLRVVRQWGGLYNITPDKQPIYGKCEVEGFYLAVGFSGHGFMFAPMTGLLIAEQILGEENTIDISKLSIDRFKKGELYLEPSVV